MHKITKWAIDRPKHFAILLSALIIAVLVIQLFIPDSRLVRTINVNSKVKRIAMSPDGDFVASADYDGYISVWKVANGEQILKIKASQNALWSV